MIFFSHSQLLIKIPKWMQNRANLFFISMQDLFHVKSFAIFFSYKKESPSTHENKKRNIELKNLTMCFMWDASVFIHFFDLFIFDQLHTRRWNEKHEGEKREWNIFYGCIHNYLFFCSMSFVCKHIRYTDVESQVNFFCEMLVFW